MIKDNMCFTASVPDLREEIFKIITLCINAQIGASLAIQISQYE